MIVSKYLFKMTIWTEDTSVTVSRVDYHSQSIRQIQYQYYYEQRRLQQMQQESSSRRVAIPVTPQNNNHQQLRHATVPSRRIPAEPQGARH